MTREEITAWLTRYAWLGTEEEQAREVECIMSQDDWEYIDVTAERFNGAQFGDGEHDGDGDEFALSALYECHDGPHLATCPRNHD